MGTEDDHAIARILAEEEENAVKYGGKLGKRLSHLDSIPHTPRVIGEIPDPNDATLDHGRLSSRLATYGLAEMQIEGRNCQEVIKQLKHFRKLYEGYVPMKYKIYLKKMKRLGEWGDHVTLQAAADRTNGYIDILPKKDIQLLGVHKSLLPNDHGTIELWLSFWSEVHYNSLYEIGEAPARVRRKRHWLF
ncbi:hypothetical protein HAX54_039128 [Datura stramonium]|uniref:OTU domain-containing protein n=1 Tax=Datura stramonium TaxID=4076 RepID=A0ABS8RN36_DATST|nr:hypothetical protein [Datura stramonium]